MSRIRNKLSYANVMATLAVFIALGGSSYAALTLPRNSVGSAQIRARAVTSSEIRDRAVRLRDLAASTRVALRGQQGPAGPAGQNAVGFRSYVNGGGGQIRGNARNVEHVGGSNEYRLTFEPPAGAPPIASCVAVAGPSGGTAGFASADPADGNLVVVKTFGQDGAARELSFQLILAC
jgi:hypothetical protein